METAAFSINLAALAVPTAVIIGIVNGFRLAGSESKKFVVTGFIAFVIAVALGIVFGLVGLFGLTIETGIVAALASSGLYKLTQNIG